VESLAQGVELIEASLSFEEALLILSLDSVLDDVADLDGVSHGERSFRVLLVLFGAPGTSGGLAEAFDLGQKLVLDKFGVLGELDIGSRVATILIFSFRLGEI